MFYFCLDPDQSPTYYNLSKHLIALGWKLSLDGPSHFNTDHFLFDSAAAGCLEQKHLFDKLIQDYCTDHRPIAHYIDDKNGFRVIEKVKLDARVWILKPALLNNGQHIKIFTSIDQLQKHYESTRRMGGPHILQEYLSPHLLQGPTSGHKYSIRMFVVLTNYAGAYLYPNGYLNIALKPYQKDDFSCLDAHLTNEHLGACLNTAQVPTQQINFFESIYPEIQKILGQVIKGLVLCYPKAFYGEKKRAVAIFGFDFMRDAAEKLWLLEANHGPCFPVAQDHPLQKKLYDVFWQDFIADFVTPIAMNQSIASISYNIFKKIN